MDKRFDSRSCGSVFKIKVVCCLLDTDVIVVDFGGKLGEKREINECIRLKDLTACWNWWRSHDRMV